MLEGGSTSARDVYSAQTGEALKITEAAGDGHGGAWNRGTGGRAGPQGTLVTPTRIQCVLVLRPFGPREREREREREARVSGHLKSTDCSDVSKASAPDKEAAPEGPTWLLLPAVCVCVCVFSRRGPSHPRRSTLLLLVSLVSAASIRVIGCGESGTQSTRPSSPRRGGPLHTSVRPCIAGKHEIFVCLPERLSVCPCVCVCVCARARARHPTRGGRRCWCGSQR